MTENRDRKYVLYRWWDADGRLLYVGKSLSLLSRISSHKNSSAFFDKAAERKELEEEFR